MSAEGKPHIERSLLARPLASLTGWVLQRPRFVVIVSLVLAAASLFLTATRLEFHHNRLALLNPNSGHHRRWLDYLDEFGDDDDVVVVVEGQHREQIVETIEDLARKILREHRHFRSLLYKSEPGLLQSKGLHFLTPEQLDEIDRFLLDIEPVVDGNWSRINVNHLLRHYNDQLENSPSQEASQGVIQIASSLSAMLSESPDYRSPWKSLPKPGANEPRDAPVHFLSPSGQLGFLSLRISSDDQGFARGGKAITRLREITANVAGRHPGVRVGVTGMPILQHDEMRTRQGDMRQAGILSLFGVACVFVAGFGGLRHPLVTVAALLVSMAWSFGFVTLAVGHLNLLSLSFGVILIGLGIDFGIHYVAQYLQLRQQGKKIHTALVATASRVGPGIVTGGVTTALAFSTAALTPFTGVAELGTMAGGGILICMFGALLLLPALILMMESKRRLAQRVPQPIPAHYLVRPVTRLPRTMLVITLGLTIVIGCFAARLRCDHNLLNLQAESLRSTVLERRLMQETDHSARFALSVAESPAELRWLKSEFEQLDCVGRVEEVVTRCLPDTGADNVDAVQSIATRLQNLPAHPPEIPISSFVEFERELTRAARILRHQGAAIWVQSPLFDESQQGDHDASTSLAEGPLVLLLERMRARLRSLAPDDYYRRLATYQQHLASDLLGVLEAIRASADPAPPALEDLPPPVRDRFVGRTQKLLLKVYARDDIWDRDELKQFVVALESRDPNITGHPVQTYHASREMQRSYVHAAVYSLLAVLIVLVLGFRSVRFALLALLPVGLGMLQLFGIMGLCDIPLNPANMIALPLILGIGIDGGVHMIRDYRHQRGRYRIGRSTATALLITSATMIAGFGTLMFSQHQGLRSLGQVLTLGVFCCMLTSMFILPAILAWLSRRRTTSSSEVLHDDTETILLKSPAPTSDAQPTHMRRAA